MSKQQVTVPDIGGASGAEVIELLVAAGDEVVVDFTPPSPGPIGDAEKDVMRHDDCYAAITQAERCVDVTPSDNHRCVRIQVM